MKYEEWDMVSAVRETLRLIVGGSLNVGEGTLIAAGAVMCAYMEEMLTQDEYLEGLRELVRLAKRERTSSSDFSEELTNCGKET